MKRPIFLPFIFACLFICFQASAQMKVITLDFASKSFAKDCEQLKNLKSGEMYQLRIVNINMNLYNVSINKSDSFIVHDVPFPTLEMIGSAQINSLLGNIVLSTIGRDNNSAPQQIAESLVKVKEKQETSALINATIEENKKKIADVEVQVRKNDFTRKRLSDSLQLQTDSLQLKADSLQIEISQLSSEISYLTSWLEQEDEEIDSLLQDIDSLRMIIIAELRSTEEQKRIVIQQEIYLANVKSLLNQAKSSFNQSDSLIAKLNNQLLAYLAGADSNNNLSQYVFDSTLTFDIAAQSAQKYRSQIESIKKSITNEQESYNAFLKNLLGNETTLQLLKNDSLIKVNHQLILETFTKALAELNTAADKISFVKISAFFSSLIHLENNQDRTYSTLPMQLNGDINKITLNITPKTSASGLQSFSETYIFPRKTFYVGLGASFYSANFSNEVYSLREPADSTKKYEFVDEKPENLELGFASLLHFGWKIPCSKSSGIDGLFGFHGTLGPAISLSSKPQFRMAAGIGFSIGKRNNMLTFDYLGMGGYVNRLSELYREDKTTDYKPENYMVSKLQLTGAVSLGYIYRF